jgi:hypothetical protein
MAFIGDDTIAGLMDRFLATLVDDAIGLDIDGVATSIGAFFDGEFTRWLRGIPEAEPWDVQQRGFPLRFLVSGYDDEGIGHIHEVLIPGPQHARQEASTANLGSVWRGQTDVILRLIKGVDWGGLLASGDPVPEEYEARLDNLGYNTLYPITVQDGLEYASFLIRTTIEMQRFSDGTLGQRGLVPACGRVGASVAGPEGGGMEISQRDVGMYRLDQLP